MTNKTRALRHLNRHYSRENTILQDGLMSIGFAFIAAILIVTGLYYVLDGAEIIDQKGKELITWIVLKLSL